MTFFQEDIVAIDFETTGQVPGQTDMPWQLGAAVLHNGTFRPETTLSIFLRVPADHHFNPYTPGRWASIRDTLSQCPTLQDKWRELAPWLTGHWLAAHNAPTERKILRQSFPLHSFGPWLDTLRLARAAYPSLESHALGDVLDALGLSARVNAACPTLAPHDALYDAVGCACLLQHILSLDGWRELTPDELKSV